MIITPPLDDYIANHRPLLTLLLTINMIALAFNDVLSDTLLVVEARKDPQRGSEDLYTYTFSISCAFGVLGALLGAYFTEYLHPYWGLFLYSWFGLL